MKTLLSVRIIIAAALLQIISSFGASSVSAQGDERSSLLTQPAFVDLYVSKLRLRFPDARISVQPDLTVKVSAAELIDFAWRSENAFALYTAHPDSLEDILRQNIDGIREISPPTFAPDINQLLPCVRNADLGSAEQNGWRPEKFAISGDLVLVYCLDTEFSIMLLGDAQLADLSATHPNFKNRAIENINKVLRTPEFTLGDGRATVVNGGNYEASLILDEAVWHRLQQHLGPTLIFAVPNRVSL